MVDKFQSDSHASLSMAAPSQGNRKNDGIKEWRCGTCLFELSKDLKPLSSDPPFDRGSFPSSIDSSFYSVPTHSIWFSELFASARRGCQKCRKLQSKINWNRERSKVQLFWQRERLYFLPAEMDKPCKDFQVFVVKEDKTSFEYPLSFHPKLSTGSSASGNTRSAAAFEKASILMKNCLQRHERCGAGSGNTTMPERILLIEGLNPLNVCLIELAKTLPSQPVCEKINLIN
jgi:hypothetical protein